MASHAAIARVLRIVAKVWLALVLACDVYITLRYHWHCRSLHFVFWTTTCCLAVWRTALAVAVSAMWIVAIWLAVWSMYAHPPSELQSIVPGGKLVDIERELGEPRVLLRKFALASDCDREMVGLWRMELELPARMWRFRGWQVWVNHVEDTVTHVSWRKYSDW